MIIDREKWRKVSAAAVNLKHARRIAKYPLMKGVGVEAESHFKLAFDAAPVLPKFKGSKGRAVVRALDTKIELHPNLNRNSDDYAYNIFDFVGIPPASIGAVLEAIGVPDDLVAQCLLDPKLAYQTMIDYAEQYRGQRQ